MPEPSTRRRLDQPAGTRRISLGVGVGSEWFTRAAESLARLIGTGTFLLWQSVIVAIWIVLNLVAVSLQWDPYPFVLLNLVFSTQAAYAAPLILLAQNRQDDRDRVSLEEDRTRAGRLSAETEYLARELASMRLQLGEVVTRDYLRDQLERGDRPDRATDDRALQKTITKTVDRAVDKAVDKAFDRAVDRAVEKALETALERAVTRAVHRVGDEPTGTNGP